MTDRQKQVLSAIIEYRSEYGYPPTLREIGEKVGIGTTNGVRCHLLALERDGYIKIDPRRARAIEVLRQAG